MKVGETIDKMTAMSQLMETKTEETVGACFKHGKWVMHPTTAVCKSQTDSVLQAKKIHVCAFAKDAIEEFMVNDWKDKETWSLKKLWNGGMKVFQLGKTGLTALKMARNSMTGTTIATTDHFIVAMTRHGQQGKVRCLV